MLKALCGNIGYSLDIVVAHLNGLLCSRTVNPPGACLVSSNTLFFSHNKKPSAAAAPEPIFDLARIALSHISQNRGGVAVTASMRSIVENFIFPLALASVPQSAAFHGMYSFHVIITNR